MKKSLFLIALFCLIGLIIACGQTETSVSSSAVKSTMMPTSTPVPGRTSLAVEEAGPSSPAANTLTPSSTPKGGVSASGVEPTFTPWYATPTPTTPWYATPTPTTPWYATPTPTFTLWYPTLTPIPGEVIHIVRSGENLFRIAQNYHVSVWAIANLNHIADIRYIQVGQCLRIPAPGQPPPEGCYTVQSQDNLYRIAKKYGLTVEEIAEANDIEPPYDTIKVGQCLIIPGVGWTVTPRPTVTPTVPWYVTPPSTPFPTLTGVPGWESFSTSGGKFSIQYPGGWRTTTYDRPDHFGFWAQETTDPFSPLIGVVSRPGVGRSSSEVLVYYKGALPGLLNDRLSWPTLTWDNNPKPISVRDALLATEDYGRAVSGGKEAKIRLIAIASNVVGREYMILLSAPTGSWPDKRYPFENVVNSFSLLR